MMVKKTNAAPKRVGGVSKDPNIRVKATMLPAPIAKEKTRISKLSQKKKLKSIFGDNAEKIHQLLETGDQDSAVSLIYKKSLQTLIDLLPFAEAAVRKSEGARGVYQINSLISSMRELMNDIQSAQDRGMLGEALVDKIIRPAYADLATEIVKEYSVISADAKALMTEDNQAEFRKTLRESRSRLADSITRQFHKVNEDTRNYLQR